MSDYNWFSKESIQVATEGLREEAKKWYDLSDRMSAVSSTAQGQGLQPTAFAVTDVSGAVSTLDLKAGYDKMNDWLNSLFKQAVTEFESLGQALAKNAEWYEHSDANSAQNFDRIATS